MNRKHLKKYVEQATGYVFNNPELIIKALTHSSYANEKDVDSNERLELLGDSVLDVVVIQELLELFPHHSEGRITIKKQKLVSNKNLAKISKTLQLNTKVILGKGQKSNKVHDRKSTAANTLEAVIGAIYVDGGIEGARNFIKYIYSGDLCNVG